MCATHSCRPSTAKEDIIGLSIAVREEILLIRRYSNTTGSLTHYNKTTTQHSKNYITTMMNVVTRGVLRVAANKGTTTGQGKLFSSLSSRLLDVTEEYPG